MLNLRLTQLFDAPMLMTLVISIGASNESGSYRYVTVMLFLSLCHSDAQSIAM